jgi:Spy/CpxP family protein refolding chaperone
MTANSRFRVLFATAVTIALLPGLAAAADQGAEDTKGKKSWYDQEAVQQKLELTADQVASIAGVEANFGPRLAAKNQEKRTAYRALMTALDAGDLPQQEFEAKRAQLEAAYGSHAALAVDRWLALRKVLTKDQWRKLPEAAPQALTLGHFGVAKRGGVYMGPGQPKPGSNPK